MDIQRMKHIGMVDDLAAATSSSPDLDSNCRERGQPRAAG